MDERKLQTKWPQYPCCKASPFVKSCSQCDEFQQPLELKQMLYDSFHIQGICFFPISILKCKVPDYLLLCPKVILLALGAVLTLFLHLCTILHQQNSTLLPAKYISRLWGNTISTSSHTCWQHLAQSQCLRKELILNKPQYGWKKSRSSWLVFIVIKLQW